MNNTLLLAAKADYEAQIAKARANIDVYLNNPAGIGEHPGIVEAVQEEISKIAEASDRLEVVNGIIEQ